MSRKEVTKEEFFKVIGPLNVHPRTNGKFRGLLESTWEMCDGSRRLVGVTSEDCTTRPHGQKRYFLEVSE